MRGKIGVHLPPESVFIFTGNTQFALLGRGIGFECSLQDVN